MEETKPGGFARSLDILTRDSIIRTMIEHLARVEDACEDIRWSVEQAEATFRKLLIKLDAEPTDSWATSRE